MAIRQHRHGEDVEEQGGLPTVVQAGGQNLLTTTIFVKYNYRSVAGTGNELISISVLCLPNGFLQDRYNPDADHGFWRAGRNAPSLGEPFRVRISLPALKTTAPWRVQQIQVMPAATFAWDD